MSVHFLKFYGSISKPRKMKCVKIAVHMGQDCEVNVLFAYLAEYACTKFKGK
jgi:hypothetical protein